MQTDGYKRKGTRIPLSVPVTIRTRDSEEAEHSYTGQVVNASKRGLKIKVDHFFHRQTVVFLTLCFPPRLRAYSFLSEKYNSYGIVVHSKRFGPTDVEIGVKLLHNQIPPATEPFAVAESPTPGQSGDN